MTKVNYFLLAFMSLFFSGAAGQEPGQDLTFSDWDKNEDTFISRSEFIEVFSLVYVDDWDLSDDPYLDDEDFYRVTYRMFDADDDKLLTGQEWMFGYDFYYRDYISDDYVAIDTSGDGFIEYEEYYSALDKAGYHEIWDIDNDTYLSKNELARLLFNNWDIDNSNFIEIDEYNKFDRYFSDI